MLVYGPPHWENIGDFDNQGVEGTLTFNPIKDLALFAGATYLDRSPEDTPYAPAVERLGRGQLELLPRLSGQRGRHVLWTTTT